MSDKENKFFLIITWLASPLINGIKHAIYILIIVFILSFMCNLMFNISLKAIIKDYVSKEFGQNSNVSKKLDESLYLHTSYNGFDRNKMIKETDNFINRYYVENIGQELEYLKPFISKVSLETYKSLYKDLHMFHYDVVFNKFDYNKDKALIELYNILLKYRCSLEKANQELFKSKLDNLKKEHFIKDMISTKIQDLLLEVIIYTKSITIEEIKEYKESRKDLKDKDIWKPLLINYYYEYMTIVRGGVCEENIFKKK